MEEQQRRDQRRVEQDRGGGVDPEFVERIEDAAEQRHEADEQQIGEGQPGKLDRKVELPGVDTVKAARQRISDGPGGDFHHCRHHDQDRQQDRQRVFGKGDTVRDAGAFRHLVTLCHLAVEHRDEGGGEGAFREQGAKQIGQAERDHERVGCEACPDEAEEQRVAQQAQHPAGERQPTDRAQRFGQVHVRSSAALWIRRDRRR